MKLTNEEAIETIKILKGLVAHGMSDQSKIVAAWDMAIEALEQRIERECLDSGGLKYCPFCGGQAYGQPEGDCWEMTCEECGCEKQGRDHDSARREWNRRNP